MIYYSRLLIDKTLNYLKLRLILLDKRHVTNLACCPWLNSWKPTPNKVTLLENWTTQANTRLHFVVLHNLASASKGILSLRVLETHRALPRSLSRRTFLPDKMTQRPKPRPSHAPTCVLKIKRNRPHWQYWWGHHSVFPNRPQFDNNNRLIKYYKLKKYV